MGSFTAGAVPPGSVRGSLQQHLAQGKGAEKKGVCDSCVLRAGKHIGGFVLIALNSSADPRRVPGGAWVWRAGEWCSVVSACCVVHTAAPVQALGRAAPLAANSLSVKVPAGKLFFQGLLLVS